MALISLVLLAGGSGINPAHAASLSVPNSSFESPATLYVDVNVYPEFNRSEIVVRRAETVGSETADKVNGTFSISAINIVSAGMRAGWNYCSSISSSVRCSLL